MDLRYFLMLAAFFAVVMLIGMASRRKPAFVLKVFGQRPDQLEGYTHLVRETLRAGISLTGSSRDIGRNTRVLITGTVSSQALKGYCEQINHLGGYPLLVKDAIANFDEIVPLLQELNEHQKVHIVTSAQMTALFKRLGSEFLYAFPKADCTATTALFFEGGKKVLVIERLNDPYKGWMTLPGGFLDVLLESLPECAVRELHEEVFSRAHKAGIKLFDDSVLRLVDVRSAPGRDPRGHIVDHGYAWLIPPELEDKIKSEICPGDDAARVWLEETMVVLAGNLAFDHKDLLKAAIELLGIKLD